MGSNEYSILPLPECKAQKLKISDCVYTYHPALLHVHPEPEFPLKISATGFKQALSCPRRSCKYYDVVCIPNHMDASALHLMVEFIEIDVRQKRTKWAALWGAFLRLNQKPVFHHATLEKSLYKFNDAFVMDLFSHHVHHVIRQIGWLE